MKIAIAVACATVLGCGGGKDGEKGKKVVDEDDRDPLVDADLKLPDEPGRNVKVDLPAVPAFDVPAPYPDGSRAVRELRLAGKRLLESELSVTGYVTWVYDCVVANRVPGAGEAETRKKIEDDPTLCERAKFYLGDAIDAAPEDSLWVVEVPRPYSATEVKRDIPKKAPNPRRCIGGEKDSICPPHKVGDKVTVTGRFALASPNHERNGELGVLVYTSMVNATDTWKSPRPLDDHPRGGPAPAAATARPPEQPLAVKPAGPLQVRKSVRAKVVTLAQEAATAFAHGQLAVGITKYQNAVEAWPTYHIGWSQLAGAYARKKEWKRAADTIDRALRLVPDAAFYHLQRGTYLYESQLAAARDEAAKKLGVKPEDVAIDPSTVDLSAAERHLATAVKLGPQLWRAHLTLGRLHLAAGRMRAAAESLTQAAQRGAPEAAAWVELGELYRRLDLHGEAIKVAETGLAVVVSAPDKASLYLLIGNIHAAKGRDDLAIEAFSKALDQRKDLGQAQFMRGQAYFKKKDFAKARLDLEAVAKVGRVPEFYRQQAARMLAEMAKR